MTIHVKQVEILILPDGRMDTRSAAGYLGLSEKTLAMMRCQGQDRLSSNAAAYFITRKTLTPGSGNPNG